MNFRGAFLFHDQKIRNKEKLMPISHGSFVHSAFQLQPVYST